MLRKLSSLTALLLAALLALAVPAFAAIKPSEPTVGIDSFTNASSYTTTINGKSIPSASYPIGSIYNSSDSLSSAGLGNGTQCHGFAMNIFKYLFGNHGTKVAKNLTISSRSDTQVKTELNSYPLGTLIRATRPEDADADYHTMILVGKDSSGVYLYHSNWSAKNTVSIQYATWSDFKAAFPTIEYIVYHTHTVSTWRSYSSTQHRGTCTTCGGTVYESHYAAIAGYSTCLACGYEGNMNGTTNVRDDH